MCLLSVWITWQRWTLNIPQSKSDKIRTDSLLNPCRTVAAFNWRGSVWKWTTVYCVLCAVISLRYCAFGDPRCSSTPLICSVFETWHFPCLPLQPPLPLCPSVSLFVRVSPRIQREKTVSEAFKDIWVISPPENPPKVFFPPSPFSISLSLSLWHSLLSVSLYLPCLCISAVFHGPSFFIYFYLTPFSLVAPFPHSPPLFSVP